MKELMVKRNPDDNDDTPERREMYKSQADALRWLFENWVSKTFPNAVYDVGTTFRVFFVIGKVFESGLEIRSELEFDRKSNLGATFEHNVKILEIWLREVFKTDSKWRIKNYELLKDEKFNIKEQQ